VIVSTFLLVAVASALTILVLLLKRAARRSPGGGFCSTQDDLSRARKDDAFDLDVGARIFSPEDSDFVASETSSQFTRTFDDERAVLALDWLRRVRSEVSSLIRDHRLAARQNPSVKPADELKLAFEFVLFQLTIGVLYGVVWVQGPTGAAKLLGFSLDLAGRLRGLAEDVVPVPTVTSRAKIL
jgi:hypothetical protein